MSDRESLAWDAHQDRIAEARCEACPECDWRCEVPCPECLGVYPVPYLDAECSRCDGKLRISCPECAR